LIRFGRTFYRSRVKHLWSDAFVAEWPIASTKDEDWSSIPPRCSPHYPSVDVDLESVLAKLMVVD
jgi:hypothetical protein